MADNLHHFLKYSSVVSELLESDINESIEFNQLILDDLRKDYFEGLNKQDSFFQSVDKKEPINEFFGETITEDNKRILRIIKQAIKRGYETRIDKYHVSVYKGKKLIRSYLLHKTIPDNNLSTGIVGLNSSGFIGESENTTSKYKKCELWVERPVLNYIPYIFGRNEIKEFKDSFIILKILETEFNCLDIDGSNYCAYKSYKGRVLPYCLIDKKTYRVIQVWDIKEVFDSADIIYLFD